MGVQGAFAVLKCQEGRIACIVTRRSGKNSRDLEVSPLTVGHGADRRSHRRQLRCNGDLSSHSPG